MDENGDIKGNDDKDTQEAEIPEEDFMIYIDDALTKIVNKLP